LSSMDSFTFWVFRLDLSLVPATWVKMDNLENQALFVSDRRNPTFSCMFPKRWGGKSNYIYVARRFEDSDEPWTGGLHLNLVIQCPAQPIGVTQTRKSTRTQYTLQSTREPQGAPQFSLWCWPVIKQLYLSCRFG
jgi:hypothetical protein